MRSMRSPPPGIRLARSLGAKEWSRNAHRCLVLVLTFVAYACYHASRKPTSIVKSVLDPEPQNPKHHHPQFLFSSPIPAVDTLPWPVGPVFVSNAGNPGGSSGDSRHPDGWAPLIHTNGDSPVGFSGDSRRTDGWTPVEGSNGRGFSGDPRHPDGWAPFNSTDGTAKLGEIDVAFLACYSIAMYAAGHLGDMLDLRLFLTAGMIGSGAFVGLFGMGYFWHLHVFGFYLAMQMLAGLLQATGWPSVVAVVGNWFGERKRGLIMGIWNAHTSVGNISGSLLAASVLQFGWGWSFVLPGALIALGGVLVFLFLAPYPEDLGFDSPRKKADRGRDEEEGLPGEGGEGGKGERGNAVGFWRACLIPGVIPFALCLFFSKLVAYTFLYWLPFYLSQNPIGGKYVSVKSAGNLSTLFDVGGIVGGILAGYISDQLNARAITAASFMYLAIPSLYAYGSYGGTSQFVNIILMMIAGLFVNGPYALITTAVSADLGTHRSLKGDSRALATVTAIIDGTGSAGAALGPLLTGFISRSGWDAVFKMLMIGAFVAGALLSVLVRSEIRQIIQRRRSPSANHFRQRGGSVATPLLAEGS